MNENDALVVAAYNAMAANLQVIYPSSVTELPPDNYVKGLTLALWNNDADLLITVLDSQDINPWEILFVQDGLGEDSPDKQSIVEFAGRQKSWACVAALVQHYQDSMQGGNVFATMGLAVVEYEATTEPARIKHLEMLMRAANVGYAKHMASHCNGRTVFYPNFACGLPKSNRFAIKDFSQIKFSDKSLGAITNKRMAMRQMALAAIADGDCTALATALDALNANALAHRSDKLAVQDGLTINEIETFTSIALGCDRSQCVNAIFSKAIELKKARSMAKSMGKKADEEQMKRLRRGDIVHLLGKILHLAKVIDHQCHVSKTTPGNSVEAAFEKSLFSAMFDSGDRYFIDWVKRNSEDRFTVMKSCVALACGHAESAFDKIEIKAATVENDQPVGAPRERVRL